MSSFSTTRLKQRAGRLTLFKKRAEETTMSKPAKPGDDAAPPVTNLSSTKKALAEIATGFRDIDKQRSDLNDYASELRERCRNQGIDPKWLLTAIRVAKMEPDDRTKADESYAIAREAIGLGLQRSLFEMMEQAEPKVPEKKPAPLKGDIAKAAAAAGMIEGHEKPKHDPTGSAAAI